MMCQARSDVWRQDLPTERERERERDERERDERERGAHDSERLASGNPTRDDTRAPQEPTL
jgi:hypothetical protein